MVYVADQDTDEMHELYSVPIDGGTVVKLNDPLVRNGVSSFAVSPDGSTVVYEAPQDSTTRELYSVPIDRSAPPVKLNGALVTGGLVAGSAISPDGSKVVYTAAQDVAYVYELYSVPTHGGVETKLNATLPSGSTNVFLVFEISPDGFRVVYFRPQDTAQVDELYSVPIDGGTPLKLNNPLASGEVLRFEIGSNAAMVAYLEWGDDEVQALYEVAIGGRHR